MALDLFEYIVFPNSEQRKETRENYFDTQQLWISVEEYCRLNSLSEKIKVEGFDSFYEIANKDFREIVRRFNNSILHLTIEIYRLTNYYQMWRLNGDPEEKIYIEIWYRYTARCVSNEIFIYNEKIKNLLRHLLKLDTKKTRRNEDFMRELKKIAVNNSYVKAFCDEVEIYTNDGSVQFVNDIRNDEIHNESCIDEYIDKMLTSDGVFIITNPRYAIRNEDLYSGIQKSLRAQLKMKNSLQAVIDNYKVQK